MNNQFFSSLTTSVIKKKEKKKKLLEDFIFPQKTSTVNSSPESHFSLPVDSMYNTVHAYALLTQFFIKEKEFLLYI